MVTVSSNEGKTIMGFAVEYTLPSGTTGLIFFSARDITEAVAYVSLMCSNYGHINVTNLTQLPSDVTVADLYQLFPRKQADSNKE
jgi:hypothetical protein